MPIRRTSHSSPLTSTRPASTTATPGSTRCSPPRLPATGSSSTGCSCWRSYARSRARSRAAHTSSTRGLVQRDSRRQNAWIGRLSLRARAFCPTPSSAGKLFKETNIQLAKLAKKYGVCVQCRRQAPGPDLLPHPDRLRPRRHRPAGFAPTTRSGSLHECARRMGGKRGWVHAAASHYHDAALCVKARVPVIWVNRTKETLDSSQRSYRRGSQPQRGRQAVGRLLGRAGPGARCASRLAPSRRSGRDQRDLADQLRALVCGAGAGMRRWRGREGEG